MTSSPHDESDLSMESRCNGTDNAGFQKNTSGRGKSGRSMSSEVRMKQLHTDSQRNFRFTCSIC